MTKLGANMQVTLKESLRSRTRMKSKANRSRSEMNRSKYVETQKDIARIAEIKLLKDDNDRPFSLRLLFHSLINQINFGSLCCSPSIQAVL